MAKQTVGPIIRHVEKAVLGVCAAAFLYIVATYGVVSPNKAILSGQEVGPEGLDQEIKTAADSLAQRLQTYEPKKEETPDPLPELKQEENPLVLAQVPPEIPRPNEFPPSPPKLPGPVIADKRPVVEVVQLSTPQVADPMRSGLYLAPPVEFGTSAPSQNDAVDLRDVNWVTVYALFDRVEQVKRCKDKNYSPSAWQTEFLGVDVERREQLPDESWTDWTAIKPWTIWSEPVYPAPKVFEAGGEFNVSPDDRTAVDAFAEVIEADGAQLALMRPLPPTEAYGDLWSYPRLQDADLLAMDAEYQEKPHCRYPECGNVKVETLDYDELMSQAEQARKDGRLDAAKDMAEAAVKQAKTGLQERKAKDLLEEIQKDLKEQPTAPSQERSQYQCLWVHDARRGSLESGHTYQYRMRAKILNQYCAKPTLLEDPKQAEHVALVGPWSEPSAPVQVPRDTLFFVTSAREQREECKAEVFKWYQGKWLARSFNATKGEMIGGTSNVPTPPDGGRAQVDFETGSRVVDIDFHRAYRPRDRRNKLLPPVETAAVVLVDDSGRLYEKLEAVDKEDPLRKEMGNKEWKP